MEVAIPSMDFDFGCILSAPSSPRRFGQCFLSAPASPARLSEFYRQFDEFSMAMERSQSRNHSVSAIPFDWEEKPGTPKSPKSGTAFPATVSGDEFGFDFAFDVSAESEMASRSAEELFDCGKIRPLTPPPRLQFAKHGDHVSPKSKLASSPRSSGSLVAQGKKLFQDVFSPKRKKQSDPFAVVAKTEEKTEQDDSEFVWEEEAAKQQYQKQSIMSNQKSSSTGSSSLSSFSSLKGSSKKWRFKDFLLFRSASEGRGSDKDHLRKYGTLFKKQEEVRNSSFRSTASDVKNSSFRSTESTGSRRRVSAHELHYTANKALSEDLKKKTFLPYKQGILGRLAFNPAVHALANGFGSMGRS